MIRKFLSKRKLSIPIILLLLSFAYLIITASGETEFIGLNSSSEGGWSVEAGVDTFGTVINMTASDTASFDTTSYYKIVTVNGMPGDAIVNVNYFDDANIGLGDAVMAVEVDPDGGYFTVYRSSTANTSGIKFYWTARWTKEDE